MNVEEFLQKMPDDWRRGPAIREWMGAQPRQEATPNQLATWLTNLADYLVWKSWPEKSVYNLRAAARMVVERSSQNVAKS